MPIRDTSIRLSISYRPTISLREPPSARWWFLISTKRRPCCRDVSYRGQAGDVRSSQQSGPCHRNRDGGDEARFQKQPSRFETDFMAENIYYSIDLMHPVQIVEHEGAKHVLGEVEQSADRSRGRVARDDQRPRSALLTER